MDPIGPHRWDVDATFPRLNAMDEAHMLCFAVGSPRASASNSSLVEATLASHDEQAALALLVCPLALKPLVRVTG